MQHRTLTRAASPAAFRESLVAAAVRGDTLARRRRAVIVPTQASAELLRQTIEARMSRESAQAIVLPDLLTRDEWLMRLHSALPGAPTWLTRIERELLLARAAAETIQRRRGSGPPFQLRPGLVAAMLDFYDELQRRQRSVRRFARTLFDELRVERGTDRGSDSLIGQTCFLGFTFLAYQRAVSASGGLDEHVLRAGLLAQQPELPLRDVVVAVADPPADPRGLWPADFDLLGRLRGVSSIDVIVTDELHDAGFRERLERELPGIEERRAAEDRNDAVRTAILMRPDDDEEGPPCFVSRDREEEVKDVAREIAARADAGTSVLPGSVAIVFQRPLPYLYLAQHVLTEAALPFHTFDTLPLAGEPYAAVFDLVLTVARSGGSREAVMALLRSRLLRFIVEGTDVGLADAAALESVLTERRAAGNASTFPGEVEAFRLPRGGRQRIEVEAARRAAIAANDLSIELQPFITGANAAAQVQAISAFLRRHERLPAESDAWRDRYLRARAAVLGALDALESALRRHHNAPRDIDTLTTLLHHTLEWQTFAPRRGGRGVHLMDAVAARFGDFADVHLVGLVEQEWPEPPRRSLFYTRPLLKALSWPQEGDRVRAGQAAFRDLLRLASQRTWLHAFQLEDDTIVSLSPLLEAARHLPAEPHRAHTTEPAFVEDVLARDGIPAGLEATPAAWLALRQQRPSLDEPQYRGEVGPQAARAYRVSRVDRYVDCPFKYFAESVLDLPDEREEASGLTPLERGTLMHELFERFYRQWQADQRGAITAATLPEAVARFAALTHEAMAPLPAADRALEEARLLGSIVARGIAERVFEIEIDQRREVQRRLLEQDLRGTFVFPCHGGLEQRSIEIRGTADRIDVLADGALRVIDYKLGRMPDLEVSVQAAVYAHCARQLLRTPDGRLPPVQSAMYIAFGDPRAIDGPVMKGRQPMPIAVETLAGFFADAVAGIESGKFPARPRHPGDCQWCPQAGVCRKEYLVEDDGDAATHSV